MKELINPISFKMNKGEEYVTMGQFREATKEVPDDTVIIMSRDGEGNGILPLYDGQTGFYYDQEGEFKYHGDLEEDETREYIEQGLQNGDVRNCILLTPIG